MDDLLLVLVITKELLSQPENAFAWSDWRDGDEATAEIDKWIEKVENGHRFDPYQLIMLFAPTGNIQEVSVSSGWGEDFLKVAEDFDRAIKKVRF